VPPDIVRSTRRPSISAEGGDHSHPAAESQKPRSSCCRTISRALHFLERFAEVVDRWFEDGRAIFDVLIAPRALNHLHGMVADVRHEERLGSPP
jgi:hypothetical protein